MAKKSIHDQLVEALVREGCTRVHTTRTERYTVFTDPCEEGKYWYVGAAGALRRGPNATKSMSMPMARRRLLKGEPLRKPKAEPSKKLGSSVKQAASVPGQKAWAKMDDDTLIQVGDRVELPEAAGGGVGRVTSIQMAWLPNRDTREFDIRVVDSSGKGHTFILPEWKPPVTEQPTPTDSKVVMLPQPVWRQVVKLLLQDQGETVIEPGDPDPGGSWTILDETIFIEDPTERPTEEQIAQSAEWLVGLTPKDFESIVTGDQEEWPGIVEKYPNPERWEMVHKILDELFT